MREIGQRFVCTSCGNEPRHFAVPYGVLNAPDQPGGASIHLAFENTVSIVLRQHFHAKRN